MILCTLTTYHTQAKERDELHRDFLDASTIILAIYIPI